jgi:SagB-type dehydrogenase family enzyme
MTHAWRFLEESVANIRRIEMKDLLSILIAFVLMFCIAGPVAAEAAKSVQLPAPQMTGGKPLMEALKARSTSREFSSEALPPQELSNLLWAACGVNRPESGKRTAPTARNMQEIDVYVALAEGLYLYDAKANALTLVVAQDLREATGKQDFLKIAPVNLVFVADYAKMGDGPKEMKDFYSATDTGYISQNVYLYCASAGLSTVVRGMVDREALAKAMNLRADQKVILAQTVGYPKK